MRNCLYILTFIVAFSFTACDNSEAPKQAVKVVEVKAYFQDSIPKVEWEYFDNDSSQILETYYYHNGQIEKQGNIAKGARFGKWTAWDEEGRILSTGYFEDGVENGMWTVWFPSGVKRYEGRFENGDRVGVWSFWNSEAELIKEINY